MRSAALAICAAGAPIGAVADTSDVKARAFWDALLGCWAVKDGALPADQGWRLTRDWTAYCGDCDGGSQVWAAGEDLLIVRERTQAGDEPTCALSEQSRPRVAEVLPGLDAIWAKDGLDWIGRDLRRPDEPFAVLLSCEPEVSARKVAVVDASGGEMKFSVTGSTPDTDAQCAGEKG